jgi:hypothetical protein
VTIENDAQHPEPVAGRPAEFRYGVVFGLMLAQVVFVIAAPSARWSRAVALAIEGAALVVAIATARESGEARYRKALNRRGGAGRPDHHRRHGYRVPAVHGGRRGARHGRRSGFAGPRRLRLLRERGATYEAVAGALVIYLALGLVFAWIIAFITHVSSTPYFAQHATATQGDLVYFSFTVLTTTGFGDFSPATPAGHALAVIEMLTGQLYLVTIIGLLIGNYASGRKTA